MNTQRRQFLALASLAGAGALLPTRFAFAGTSPQPNRFVLILLRGALDGLAAVPPYGDPDYVALRRESAIGADTALKLDGLFGLNPGLKFLHESYTARELLVMHAVATPYRERSHFDGQDVLENGMQRAHATQTGWLNRALLALPAAQRAGSKDAGVALGQNLPLVMRGPAPVASWSPSKLPAMEQDTLQRISDLYAADPLLSQRLAAALDANAVAASAQMSDAQTAALARQPARGAAQYLETVRAAGAFLRAEDGPAVAVFDTTGWDTHANEGGVQGQIAIRLGALDQALHSLKESLGPVWDRTAILIATEFGRTAALNGTRGTDHGTGAAAFLLGGAVKGGRVLADWPGLSARSLYQGRDLMPTLDLRSVTKSVLRDHLGIPVRALEDKVFPDSRSAPYFDDLLRSV
ncbi:MAG: DUF1501 domain-containing protein [Steroidobacteraceae bacterium]